MNWLASRAACFCWLQAFWFQFNYHSYLIWFHCSDMADLQFAQHKQVWRLAFCRTLSVHGENLDFWFCAQKLSGFIYFDNIFDLTVMRIWYGEKKPTPISCVCSGAGCSCVGRVHEHTLKCNKLYFGYLRVFLFFSVFGCSLHIILEFSRRLRVAIYISHAVEFIVHAHTLHIAMW